MDHPLDNPIWQALCGPHRRFAVRHGLAAHYPRDMAVFSATADDSAQAWADLAHDLPAGAEARLLRRSIAPAPAGWTQCRHFALLQMVAAEDVGAPPDGLAITSLGPGDKAEVAALIALTQPGPFAERTMAMGRYFGIFEEGRLLAMAGERLNLDSHVEMSAICTHPQARGRGLAVRLVRHLMHGARARGQTPFLHVLADNEAAIALYRRLGFAVRAEPHFLWYRREAEGAAAAPPDLSAR